MPVTYSVVAMSIALGFGALRNIQEGGGIRVEGESVGDSGGKKAGGGGGGSSSSRND